MEQILNALQKLGIDSYMVNETKRETMECFFIRRRLDLKRSTEVTEYTVTVYRPVERDGQRLLGESSAQIYPMMSEQELETALSSAYASAAFAVNPFYELLEGCREAHRPSDSSLAGVTKETAMKQMAEAIFAEDDRKEVFVNSAEIFVENKNIHIRNSRGVDVSFQSCEVNGEYVIQCLSPQDVETHHSFRYRGMDTEALREDVKRSLEMTQARASAVDAPQAGVYRILLSGESVYTLLEYYLSRANAGLIYQKYSNYRAGDLVQGEKIKGDALTVRMKASEPYSPEGIPMKDRVLLQDGILQTIYGGVRYSRYLDIEPTGIYSCIEVPTGDTPLAELKAAPYLHIVSFSDFQMDSLSGHFGGEIRLGFLFDGETVRTVTGGSINGSILRVQENMKFSKERFKNGSYEGPFAVALEGVQVAGA